MRDRQQQIQGGLRGLKTLVGHGGGIRPLPVSVANIMVKDNVYLAFIGTSVNVKPEVLAAGAFLNLDTTFHKECVGVSMRFIFLKIYEYFAF